MILRAYSSVAPSVLTYPVRLTKRLLDVQQARRFLDACLLPVLIFLLWLVAVQQQWLALQILPPPSLVLTTAGELAGSDLGANIAASLYRLTLGLIPGVLAGIVLGMVTGLSRRNERLIYPAFVAWSQIPNLALIPVLMIFFGIGDMLKIIIIFNATLVPMLIHTQAGVRDVSHQLREAAQVMCLNFWQQMVRLYIPASLPAVMTGLRLAMSAAWTSLVVVELLASSDGIGYLLVWGRQMFQIDIVFVCIAVIGLLGLMLDCLVHQLDRMLIRWPRPALARHHEYIQGWSLLPWVLPAVLAWFWWFVTTYGWVNAHDIPAPAKVWQALREGFSEGWRESVLGDSMIQSLARYMQGLFWGMTAGLITGLLCGLSAVSGRLLSPTLGVLRHIVIFAWLPLLTAWAGTGETARILFIAIAVFFPVFVATQRGVANLPQSLVEAASVLRLGFLQRLHYLVLPGASSSIFAGLRLGLIYGWLATIGAEYFMASSVGIGSLMINAQQLMHVDVIFAGLLLVSLTGTFLNMVGHLLEKRLQRWRRI